VYAGPIGSVLSPALFGQTAYGHLSHASSLCGACAEACPVGIDIPRLLLEGRAEYEPKPLAREVGAFGSVALSPARYRWAQRAAALASRLLPRRQGWITRLPGPLSAWTRLRDFPPFAARPLRSRLRRPKRAIRGRSPELPAVVEPREEPWGEPALEVRADLFEAALKELGADVIRCGEQEAPDRIVGQLFVLGAGRLLSWGPVEPILFTVLQRLGEEGFPVELPDLPEGEGRARSLRSLAEVPVGLTGAMAAFADTGTLVLSAGSRRSLLPSLLPETHLAVVRLKDVYPSLSGWLQAGGSGYAAGTSNLVMISGPSRTADIEMTLTVGVHGPRQLIVFLIE
jgi:L-lactate utilization protein LutC